MPNVSSYPDIFVTIEILLNALEAGHALPGNARGSTACPDPALLLAEPEDSLDDSDSDTHAEFVAGKIEGTSIEFEELFLSVLKLDPLLQLEEIGAVASGLPALD
ncbi:hypothetical protein B0H13DRAFT_2363742 [Mycena leptocephala]|nr:hypothetical protein B0H13DRAFT_2382584 [Mycena leptocephala]KAJ7845289.1 hypothetical protein B0H13DRAFT_2363737 [Mycena leptocephala]KAJ7845294.1 hypothetical protein B0H13DRAFT_2363742 [Mycena leptocephala]